jgi:hypothetical protein
VRKRRQALPLTQRDPRDRERVLLVALGACRLPATLPICLIGRHIEDALAMAVEQQREDVREATGGLDAEAALTICDLADPLVRRGMALGRIGDRTLRASGRARRPRRAPGCSCANRPRSRTSQTPISRCWMGLAAQAFTDRSGLLLGDKRDRGASRRSNHQKKATPLRGAHHSVELPPRRPHPPHRARRPMTHFRMNATVWVCG